ncbi:MAG: CRISPR-associated RAMP protein [Virgibacillus proomii]|jgi:CRISPR/Cas system CSM-associated protein Csm3 (group 7 of RAMP superfamily)
MQDELTKNKITKRTYIEIKGKLASPLLAGSGEDDRSNMDILCDYYGHPFLAGTAVAGACRQWLLENKLNEQAIDSLFGAKKKAEKQGNEEDKVKIDDFFQSRMFISDLKFESPKTTIRDHVRLTGNKTADETGKFNVEVIDTGASFVMQLEYIERENTVNHQDEKLIKSFISGINRGELTFGGKSNRGYGKLEINEVKRKQFHYTNKETVMEWLDWSWGKMSQEQPESLGSDIYNEAEEKFHVIIVPLKIKQTLLIRDYQTMEEDVDYTYLRSNKKPVIPGTTWAGAFRYRLHQIVHELDGDGQIVEELFGCKHYKEQTNPSRLIFEESVIENAKKLTVTRNAIDRFSGETIDGALFTGETVCKGQTTLVIRWRKDSSIDCKIIKGIMYWLIKDLACGFLAIGGETAIGRGVFELQKETSISDLEKEAYQKEAITWIGGGEKDATSNV